MKQVSLALLFAALAVGASARTPAPPTPMAASSAGGYLRKDQVPDSILILPPPPVKGSTEDRLDTETYASTRALAGTPRWALATRDATQYAKAFECPLGLTVADFPRPLTVMLARMARDAGAITNLAKDHYKHPRPFIAPNGPICTESDRAGLIKSPSYPSGHTTYSWAVGLVLAELAPEHASEILARARAFGESRVVCGVHTVSDVEEGRTNGSALIAVLHADPAFRADLETAGKALKAALAAPHAAPDAGQCKVEADAEMHTPWVNPDQPK